MFDSADQIREVVNLLETRQASIWHACQLTDLRSYLQLGGVPSRQRLERERLVFTAFESDRQDRVNQVWDKVFFNLSDFGGPFAHGARNLPNPYGPITLQLAPSILSRAEDIAICLRSAGAREFDRSSESLATVDEVNRLYLYPTSYGFPRMTFVKSGEGLADAFPAVAEAHWPEVSCTYGATGSSAGLAPIGSLVVIWTDPIRIDGRSITDAVRAAVRSSGVGIPVHERSMISVRRQILQNIVDQLVDGYVPLKLLPGRRGVASETQSWANDMRQAGREWLWDRYARYLIEGTIGPMMGRETGTWTVKAPRPSIPAPVSVAEILNGFKEQ